MVVVRAGVVLGMVHYLFHRSRTSIAPVCCLQDLFTTESERGKGVGRALIEAVYGAARAGGVERVYWQTHETNATAMRLYEQVAERSGFCGVPEAGLRSEVLRLVLDFLSSCEWNAAGTFLEDVCARGGLKMHNLVKAVVLVAVLGGAVASRAQLVDPTTGMTVNAATDPVDFSAVASGRGGNPGTEASAAAMEPMKAVEAQQEAQQREQEEAQRKAQDEARRRSQEQTQEDLRRASDFRKLVESARNDAADADADDDSGSARMGSEPVPLKTTRPRVFPNGGKVAAGTRVTLNDADGEAHIFYTTDGSRPTSASMKYTGPIVVTAEMKLRVLAFDTKDEPSAIVTTVFKVKR